MKKLLLLDADVIMDLHTLGLFEKITKTYEVSVARTVVDEAQYFKRGGKKHKIDISDSVTIIDNVDIESLKEAGHHKKNLYPRHFEKMFRECIEDGKVRRVQFKKLT
ncbi:MAG: hypothetical protein JRC66_04455 [Deltaproteobacteria bacterium]|nr:hypothetical protein [Deltaproteobacteria bacterium]